MMNIKTSYKEAVQLCYVKCLNDPENDPYKSKYEAKKIFNYIKDQLLLSDKQTVFDGDNPLTNEFDDLDVIYDETTNMPKIFMMKDKMTRSETNISASTLVKHNYLIRLLLHYHIATIYNDTEEKMEGEKYLKDLLVNIENVQFHPYFCSLNLHVLNQLILIQASYDKYDQAILYASQAEHLYKHWMTVNQTKFPLRLKALIEISINDSISEKKRCHEFELTYTHTLYYLAQVYAKLNEKEQSAKYCQLTLERQLLHRDDDNFNAVDWATNSATLSQYYMGAGDYPTARHCLVCADLILEEIKTDEKVLERSASFKRCWGKYAINLLADSTQRLLRAADNDLNPNEIISKKLVESKFRFKMKKDNIEKYEQEYITAIYVLDYEQARHVFLFGLNQLNKSKEYYVLDGFVSDYVEICQDISQLYNKLVFFESDIERQCKMHKRRIDLLSPLCNELNEQYYLHCVRQLLFELGECYSTILDLKLTLYDQTPSIHLTKKINQLAHNGIQIFERFLLTMYDKKTKQLPEKYSDDYLRSAILAHFYIGRFYSKIQSMNNLQNRLNNLEINLTKYKYIVDYCERYPDAKQIVENEYNVCKEMCVLLPCKMDKLRESLS